MKEKAGLEVKEKGGLEVKEKGGLVSHGNTGHARV